MKGPDSAFRSLKNMSWFTSFLNTRRMFNFSRGCLSKRCLHSPSPLSGQTGILELTNPYAAPSWNMALEEGKKILEKKYGLGQSISNFSSLLPAENVIKRLQSFQDGSTHLINIFKNLLCDHSSSAHWPGTVTLLLTKTVGTPFAGNNVSNPDLECDVTWKSQLIVADVVNLLQRTIDFQKECERLQLPTKGQQSITRRDPTRLVSHYFTCAALHKIGLLNNCKATWLISSILESLAEAGSQICTAQMNCDLLCTLDDWEYSTLHPQAILLGNGCRAVLELTGHGKTVQQMALTFARYLVLALKAHSDIHHFVQYQKSEISYFKLNALPVVLHLENNPEVLAYIYSCENVLDNLDHSVIYSEVTSGPSLKESNKLLESYIQAAVQILKEFRCSPENKNLIKMMESLKNVRG